MGRIRDGLDALLAPAAQKEVSAPIDDVEKALSFSLVNIDDYPNRDFDTSMSYREWVYANISAIATPIASIQFKLYQGAKSKEGGLELTEIDTHELLDLLNKPNAHSTRSELMWLTSAHLLNKGKAFWWKVRPGQLASGSRNLASPPTELVPLQPEFMQIKPDMTDSTNLIASFTYKLPNGKELDFSLEDIIYLRRPNPRNIIDGLGVVDAAQQTIQIDSYSAEYNRRYFKNSARPDMILSTPGRLAKDSLARLRSEWNKIFGRVQNANKVAILDSGLTMAPVQPSAKDMDFIKQQEWTRDKLMALFGNTKMSLGIVEDVNRASAETSEYWHSKNTVKPLIQLIVDQLNEYLVPLYGEDLILDFDDPVPENRLEQVDEAKALVGIVLTPNEVREGLGYPPIDGGDELAPATPFPEVPPIAPTGKIAHKQWKPKMPLDAKKSYARKILSARKPVDKRGLKGVDKAVESVDNSRIETLRTEIASFLVSDMRKKKSRKIDSHKYSPHFTNAEVEAYWWKQIRISEDIERRFAGVLRRMFEKMKTETLAKVKSVKSKAIDDMLFDEQGIITGTVDLLSPLMQEIVQLEGQEAFNLLGLSEQFNAHDIAAAYAKDYTLKFAKSYTDTARERIAEIISEGIDSGKSIPKIKDDISADFDTMSRVKVDQIARTETLRAANYGTIEAYKQSGIVSGKSWLTSLDDKVCDYCEPLEGKIVELDGNFFDKGDSYEGNASSPLQLNYDDVGSPPLHPACRCTTIPVLVDQTDTKSKALLEIRNLRDELARTKELLEEEKAANEEIKEAMDAEIDEAVDRALNEREE